MLSEIIRQLKTVPEYFFALKGALAVLASGLPIYAGIRYFMYRRKLYMPLHFHLAYMSSFILLAGLTFLYASPLAGYMHPALITIYLVLTCLFSSYGIMMLIDVFLVQHYMMDVRKLYVSPPLRTIIRITFFIFLIFPSLHFFLHFNPLTAIAIPTIATAGLALALQDTLKTFIAGVGLGNIIRLGDWVGFQGRDGQVVNISWARTILRTADGNYIFIPNSQLQNGLFMNYSAVSPANRIALKVGASYDASPSRVKEVLMRCLRDVPAMAATPAPVVNVQEYAESSVIYGVYCWVEDYSKILAVQDEVFTRIWYAFRREGIEMPYPIRTLYVQRASQAAQKNQEHIERTLQEWTLAEAFFAEELHELSQYTVSRSYAGGESIVKQGDPGQSLFVIIQGKAGVYKDDRPQAPVATLHDGDIFGEMSLLTGEARSATVRAEGPVEVLEIKKAGLQKVIARRPELSDKLARLVAERQTVASAQAGSPPLTEGQVEKGVEAPSLSGRIRHFFGL